MRLLGIAVACAALGACATQSTAETVVQIAHAACVNSWGGGNPSSFSIGEWHVQSEGREWRVWTEHKSDNRCYEVRISKIGDGPDPASQPLCLTCVAY